MLAENTAVVAVPNEFTRNQLEGRLRTRIEDTLSERLGKPVRLAVSVDPTLERTGHDPHSPQIHVPEPPQGRHALPEPAPERVEFPTKHSRGVHAQHEWTPTLLDKPTK